MVKQFSLFEFGLSDVIHRKGILRGVGLLEAVLAIGLMLVLAFLSVPAWRRLHESHGFDRVLLGLQGTVRFAQMSALMQGQAVTVCGSAHGVVCDGRWTVGALVLDHMGGILRYWRNNSGSVQISWRGSFGRNHRLKFMPAGFTLGQQGRFYVCKKQAKMVEGVAVVINSSGRQRVDRSSRTTHFCGIL